MADNVTITPGSGKTVLADEVTEGTLGTGIVQVIKVMDATINGTNLLVITAAGAAKVDGSAVTQPVSGTFFQATQPVSAASLPLPTGAATAAKQPALGTAGTASADVITVQGKASMTPVLVDGSAVTQPVSGTVTTTPPSNASTNVAQLAGTATDTNSGAKSAGTLRVVLATDQPALTAALKVDGSAVTQPTQAVRSGTGTPSNVASSASSVTILASNANRLGATVTNDSTQILYLLLGSSAASTTNYTVQLAGSTSTGVAYYEVPFGFTGQLTGIWASANGNARVTELSA